MIQEGANREVYLLLKEGIKASVPDREHGGQKTERLRVVDWEQPENNDFLLVSQLSVTGPLYTCRLDLVGFVNGLIIAKVGIPSFMTTLGTQFFWAGMATVLSGFAGSATPSPCAI